jgi:hypothetical protein
MEFRKSKKAEKARQELEQKQQEAQQQAQQQQAQMQQMQVQQDALDKEKDRQLQIELALIGAESKNTEGQDSIKLQDMMKKHELKERELDIKEQELAQKMNQSSEE